jgi:DNA repair protein RecO (recombination protein O)
LHEHPSPPGGGAGGGVDHVGPPSTRPNSPAPPSVADLVTRFELVWLKELGYSPRLDVCTGCGKAVPGDVARVWFSPAAGGVVCTPCSPAQPDRRPLSGDALRALAALAAGPAVDLECVRGELRGLLGQVVSFVLGRRPRMHRFLADR